MQQNLFHIWPTLLNIPVFGFGIALAIWLVASIVLMAWLFYRYGWNESTFSYLPVLAVLGAIIYFVMPMLEEYTPDKVSEGVPIRGYGVMLLAGVLAGVYLASRRFRQVGLSSDLVYALALWMVLPGIIGARLFFMIQKHEEFAWNSPVDFFISVFQVHTGGLVVYGGLIGGLIGGILFCQVKRLPKLVIGDLIAPSMFIGLALGRIGCMLNGCCFSGPCEHETPWMVTFPAQSHSQGENSPPYQHQLSHGAFTGILLGADDQGWPVVLKILDDAPRQAGLAVGDRIVEISGESVKTMDDAYRLLGKFSSRSLDEILEVKTEGGDVCHWTVPPLPERSRPVHPTQLYSSINAALICLLALAWHPFRRRDGETFALALTLYAFTRFILEIIRTDELGVFGTPFTISQWVSLALLVPLIGLWIYVLRQPKGQLWAPPFPPEDQDAAG